MMSVLLFSLFACKKKYKDINVNADLVRAFSFKQGTYWVYKNLMTGAIDSYYVVKNYSRSDIDGEGNKVYMNNIEAITNNLNILSFTLRRNVVGFTVTKIKFGVSLYYPFLTGNGTSSDTIEVIDVVPTMQVNSITYKDVSVVNIKYLNQHDDTLFISNTSGVIKMNIHNDLDTINAYYELINSNTIK